MSPQRRGPRHLAKAALGAILLSSSPQASAEPTDKGKKVFAHYMVGDSTTEHRHQDILDAKAIGIDGFSLNIGKPDRDFVRSSLNELFDFASSQGGFGLHISMDLWAAGDNTSYPYDTKGVPDYKSLCVDFFGNSAYERGSNGFPIVTTFSSGGTNNATWDDWRNQFAQEVFLIPNLDGIPGYWEFHPGFWEHWGPVVDGLFSWESAWPERNGKGGAFAGDIEPDVPLMDGLKEKNKKYMIPLSPLQYKDAYKTNIYRAGHLNLPTRMQSILEHRDEIQYVNILTWNDGPESHYVGNLWDEQNSDPEPAHYMHMSHKAWQPLLGSFITAFKGDGVMRPFNADSSGITGAYWYKTILSETTCPEDADGVGIEEQYLVKPESFENAQDLSDYAIILPEGASGWSLKVNSGGTTDVITGLKAGLNYGHAQLEAGAQSLQLLDASGNVVATASGGRCVYGGDTCPDCTYNVNPTVIEFKAGSGGAVFSNCNEKCGLKSPDSGDGDGEDDGVGGDPVYLGPGIYLGSTAQCNAPCTLVLPPKTLDSATTISIPPYTTSLEIAAGTTTTIVVTVPALTTKTIEYYNVQIPSSQGASSFNAAISVSVPPITTVLTAGGVTQTRTLQLPPWPSITKWASGGYDGSSGGGSGTTTTSDGAITTPDLVTIPSVSKTPYTQDDNTPTGTWPDEFEIIPVETDVSEDGEDDDGSGPKSKTTCKLWFFFICISWGDIKIGGWEWNLPEGTWGPGVPPTAHLKFPTGVTIKGNLPPWPKITVGPNGEIDSPPEPESCTPVEASLCMTTSSYGTTVSAGTTKTTATQVTSTCATISGCELEDSEATQTAYTCGLKRRAVDQVTDWEFPEMTAAPDKPQLKARATEFDWNRDCEAPDGRILLPQNPGDDTEQQIIRDILEARQTATGHKFHEFRANELGFTAFYYVEELGTAGHNYLNSPSVPEVATCYVLDEDPDSAIDISAAVKKDLKSRAIDTKANEYWHLSHMSYPWNLVWDEENAALDHDPSKSKYSQRFDDSYGRGQTIYIIEPGWVEDHKELQSINKRTLTPHQWGPQYQPEGEEEQHGTLVAAYAVGPNVGVARNANLVFVPSTLTTSPQTSREKMLQNLVEIANDFSERGLAANSAIVNMSFSMNDDARRFVFYRIFVQLMQLMERTYGIMFIAAAGNDGGEVNSYPPLAADNNQMMGMIVVGASNMEAEIWIGSVQGDLVDVYAPGEELPPPPPMAVPDGVDGTSFAAPLVAGLAAYFRAHPRNTFGASPAKIKELIVENARVIKLKADEDGEAGNRPDIVWNGMTSTVDCMKYSLGTQKLEDEDECPTPSNGDAAAPQGPSVSFQIGTPGPLCESNECGDLCEDDYYCDQNPTGTPPDFTVPLPELPAASGVPSPSGGVCASTTTVTYIGGPRGDATLTSSACASYTVPASAEPTGNSYIETCQDCAIPSNAPWLECVCSGSGNSQRSALDLDKCVANDGGVMVARANGGFSASCNTISLDGNHVKARCDNGDTVTLGVLDLSDFIIDNDSHLECFGLQGAEADS